MRGVQTVVPTQAAVDRRTDTIDKIKIDLFTKKIDAAKAIERFKAFGHSEAGAKAAVHYLKELSPKFRKRFLAEKHLTLTGKSTFENN